MLRSEKQGFVSELEGIYKQAGSIIVTHYHGLTVSQISSLRKDLGGKGGKFKVIKNTLSRIAAGNAEVNELKSLLSGPTAIAYSEDPVTAAKVVVNFAKSHENLVIVGGVVNGKLLSRQDVQQLSKLPSLDELRGKIVGLLQAPSVKIARVLQAPASQIARVLQAYADKS